MEMILLNQEQADSVRGKYGTYSALEPIEVVEGWALPIDILTNNEFKSIYDILNSYPKQEVTLIESKEDDILDIKN